MKDFITVYESIGGWKAVHMWWNEEDGGFYEPWQTGLGAYATCEEAADEGRLWAECEDLKFVEACKE